MQEYMACLKQYGSVAEQCRPLAKKYFECRMDRYAFCDALRPLVCVSGRLNIARTMLSLFTTTGTSWPSSDSRI